MCLWMIMRFTCLNDGTCCSAQHHVKCAVLSASSQLYITGGVYRSRCNAQRNNSKLAVAHTGTNGEHAVLQPSCLVPNSLHHNHTCDQSNPHRRRPHDAATRRRWWRWLGSLAAGTSPTSHSCGHGRKPQQESSAASIWSSAGGQLKRLAIRDRASVHWWSGRSAEHAYQPWNGGGVTGWGKARGSVCGDQ